MPIKYKNGRVAKEGDPVVGLDWRGGVVQGTAITGDTRKGLPELIFQHGIHKTACPSLALENFLHGDDAVIDTTGIHSVAIKPATPKETKSAPPTGAA